MGKHSTTQSGQIVVQKNPKNIKDAPHKETKTLPLERLSLLWVFCVWYFVSWLSLL